MIEIWQANAAGRYAHPADARDELPLEDGFTGFGRSGTVDGGRFAFVVVKPGRVPWPEGGLQAPHLLRRRLRPRAAQARRDAHVLPGRGRRERVRPGPRAARPEARARRSSPAPETDGSLRFDIRLQGPGQTTFFAV